MSRQEIRSILIYLSFFLFPLTYYWFSPYLIIMGASEGVINGSFVVFILLFLSSLFFGRGFCGWLCPASGAQSILQKAVSRTLVNGKKNIIKYIIWIPWITIIVVTAISAGGYTEIDPMFQMIGTLDMLSIEIIAYFAIYYIVLSLVVILHFTAGQRGFCHTTCWMAPFMIIGTKIRDGLKFPGFRLHADSDNCVECTRCNKTCPMNLDVMTMVKSNKMANTECIMCLNCVDSCKKGALTYGFGRSTDAIDLVVV
ncbi:MAG: 4Fe-4S binding protein [Candidatus Heimdallarchaeota archaeon]|nr:4Fe-4S binding protein [Candidatus Heimdallarchaeota archaeon]